MFRVAVCICTCDRAALLARLLEAVEQIDLGDQPAADTILVVVDNRPDGQARAICDSHAAKLPIALRFLEEPTPGISFARNRATAEALSWGADAVAFLDDDDVPRPDWLRRLIERQKETGADLVFGLWELPEAVSVPRWLQGTRYFRPPRPHDRNRYGLPAWAGTYNVMLSRRMIEGLNEGGGPFRPEFALSGGGDSDLFIRARNAGFSHACAETSIVVRTWEPDRMTMAGMLRRGFKLGGSKVHVARAHLPTAEQRGLALSSWRKLAKAIVRLPLVWNRPLLVGRLVAIAHALGEVRAWSGLRYGYYERRR
jgi:glycosyltransferase involved in cell wall biosynthesis